jgi:hypothetical protein
MQNVYSFVFSYHVDIQTSQPYICYTCREGTLSQRCSRVIEAMILYDKKKYFSYPVPLSCLSYWRVVKHPMNFFEIKAKAYYDLYQDSKDFLMDLFVTFFNTKVCISAITLLKKKKSWYT